MSKLTRSELYDGMMLLANELYETMLDNQTEEKNKCSFCPVGKPNCGKSNRKYCVPTIIEYFIDYGKEFNKTKNQQLK